MKDFGDYLKNIRVSNNLTQTQFAAQLNIDAAALSKIENGKKEFDPTKLELLSSKFKININELKTIFFGEKIALELYSFNCPMKTLKVAEEKYLYLGDS